MEGFVYSDNYEPSDAPILLVEDGCAYYYTLKGWNHKGEILTSASNGHINLFYDHGMTEERNAGSYDNEWGSKCSLQCGFSSNIKFDEQGSDNSSHYEGYFTIEDSAAAASALELCKKRLHQLRNDEIEQNNSIAEDLIETASVAGAAIYLGRDDGDHLIQDSDPCNQYDLDSSSFGRLDYNDEEPPRKIPGFRPVVEGELMTLENGSTVYGVEVWDSFDNHLFINSINGLPTYYCHPGDKYENFVFLKGTEKEVSLCAKEVLQMRGEGKSDDWIYWAIFLDYPFSDDEGKYIMEHASDIVLRASLCIFGSEIETLVDRGSLDYLNSISPIEDKARCEISNEMLDNNEFVDNKGQESVSTHLSESKSKNDYVSSEDHSVNTGSNEDFSSKEVKNSRKIDPSIYIKSSTRINSSEAPSSYKPVVGGQVRKAKGEIFYRVDIWFKGDSYIFLNSMNGIVTYYHSHGGELHTFYDLNEKEVLSWALLIKELNKNGINGKTIERILVDNGLISDDTRNYLLTRYEWYCKHASKGVFGLELSRINKSDIILKKSIATYVENRTNIEQITKTIPNLFDYFIAIFQT